MSHSYLCVRGNTTDHYEADAPNIAAQQFSVDRNLRKGSTFKVLDRLNKARTYKVGPNPRSLKIVDVERVL